MNTSVHDLSVDGFIADVGFRTTVKAAVPDPTDEEWRGVRDELRPSVHLIANNKREQFRKFII